MPTAELQEHLDLCGSETPRATPEIRPPPMIACHISGKEFGSKSIAMALVAEYVESLQALKWHSEIDP